MKKLLALILVVTTVFTLAACVTKRADEVENTDVEVEETAAPEETVAPEETEVPGETEEPEATASAKPEATPSAKPENKPTTAPTAKPTTAPTAKPTTAPTKAPETPKTAGNILLDDFKARANSSSSALSIAEALSTNSIINFMAGAMEVEPGYLSGFDNAEITGFKEGAVFMPMIGSIPFIGYVFTLEDGVSASDFISTLKSNANLRWNICVEAEEMVAGSVGNKVFFVMCNKDLSAE